MLHIGYKIFNTLILFVVGLAFVGVNVSKLYCKQCKGVHLQIQVMLQAETPCSCEHGCTCSDEDSDDSDYGRHNSSEHQFYKLTDPSQTEEAVECPDIFCQLDDKQPFFEPALNIAPDRQTLFEEDDSPDPSSRISLLCTYRC